MEIREVPMFCAVLSVSLCKALNEGENFPGRDFMFPAIFVGSKQEAGAASHTS